MEIWHRNVLELLDGPSADLNLGLWIPDLFMKRLRQQGQWTLLDPAEAAELNPAVMALLHFDFALSPLITKQRARARPNAASLAKEKRQSCGKES